MIVEMMMHNGSKLGEILPFIVMVIMEGCTIGLTIMAKTVMSGGMSPFVFVVYTNALGTLLLIPYSFLFHYGERTEQSLFTFPLLLRVFFLGFTGIALSQNLAFLGLSYSSPIVVCAMGLLIPSISFLLSLLLRKSKVEWKKSSFQIKAVGTMMSVMGTLVEEFYKGPVVKSDSSHKLKLIINQLFVFYSTPDRWILGGLLLAASTLCVSVWNIIQLGTIKHHPHVMKIASFYSLAGTVQCAIFSLIIERDLDAWKLKFDKELVLIIGTAIFGSVVRSTVQVWCTRMKGPAYVPMFQPFRIVWATFFAVSFFATSIHYGSILGAVIAGVGYYTVQWGQMRENEKAKENTADDEKVPLLQEVDSEV